LAAEAEHLLVSNTSVPTSHRGIRWLLWCFCAIGILLLLVATFDHVQQLLIRQSAKRVLAGIQAKLLRQTAAEAQASQPLDEGAERVLEGFIRLVGDGALLTPESSKDAQRLLYNPNESSDQQPILLMTAAPTPGIAAKRWTKEDQVEVDMYWSEDIGSVDSAFRYQPPGRIHAVVTTYTFVLRYTGSDNGVRQWKVDGLVGRYATIEKAITYLTNKSGRTNDAQLRKNIQQTVATLKRMSTRRNACAC
jgi:hypothetical protein